MCVSVCVCVCVCECVCPCLRGYGGIQPQALLFGPKKISVVWTKRKVWAGPVAPLPLEDCTFTCSLGSEAVVLWLECLCDLWARGCNGG